MNYKHDHIHVRCVDPEASEKWWTEVMGLEVLKRGGVPGMPITRLGFGDMIISLSPPREGVEVEEFSGKNLYGMYQLGVTVDDLEATVEELRGRGAKVTLEPTEMNPGMMVSFIQAPDGVEIELMQYM